MTRKTTTVRMDRERFNRIYAAATRTNALFCCVTGDGRAIIEAHATREVTITIVDETTIGGLVVARGCGQLDELIAILQRARATVRS